MEILQITGYIGSDAECKQESENKFLTRFSVASTKRWNDRETGEEKESTNWYTIFRRSSKHPQKLLNHLKKGNKIYIAGQPSYGVNTHGNGVRVEVILNSKEIEILTFVNSIQGNSNENPS
ncbi:single-stranded DNA-binding protein [Christiangramia sp. SM2212]|uniref:Single-stranded DNA-binding protein n=1 Tax=Christiangramia sediminicola TaxID=3073267 RepID=A0ABU1EPE6_9FLAO|nr:single-stranded DNA-binding protein [Christiangramia sp. SM2212]MDR5590266.1 single-stranded DNA-binding protein [Christiangramia sp. SM2212]